MRQLIALTKNTFRETIRDKILFVIVFFGVVFVLSSQMAAEISARQNDKITLDFGLAMINIFGVLITVFVGTSLLHKEIDRKTIFTLLSKPVPRSIFIFSKFCGLGAVLFLITALMAIIFFLLVPFSLSLLVAISIMFLSFLLLLAVVLFFSSFMQPLLAAFSALIVFVIGHITDDIRMFAHYNDVSPIFKKFADGLYYFWPNFEILNLKNVVVYSFDFPVINFFYAGVMALSFILLLIFFSVIIFSRREF